MNLSQYLEETNKKLFKSIGKLFELLENKQYDQYNQEYAQLKQENEQYQKNIEKYAIEGIRRLDREYALFAFAEIISKLDKDKKIKGIQLIQFIKEELDEMTLGIVLKKRNAELLKNFTNHIILETKYGDLFRNYKNTSKMDNFPYSVYKVREILHKYYAITFIDLMERTDFMITVIEWIYDFFEKNYNNEEINEFRIFFNNLPISIRGEIGELYE